MAGIPPSPTIHSSSVTNWTGITELDEITEWDEYSTFPEPDSGHQDWIHQIMHAYLLDSADHAEILIIECQMHLSTPKDKLSDTKFDSGVEEETASEEEKYAHMAKDQPYLYRRLEQLRCRSDYYEKLLRDGYKVSAALGRHLFAEKHMYLAKLEREFRACAAWRNLGDDKLRSVQIIYVSCLAVDLEGLPVV